MSVAGGQGTRLTGSPAGDRGRRRQFVAKDYTEERIGVGLIE